MDIQQQERFQRDLLNAWDEGRGDADATELRAGIVATYMRGDDDVARFHFPIVEKVANGSMRVQKAHLVLHECYRRGRGVQAQPDKALHYLNLAIECGSDTARWYLGCYLLGDEAMSSVISVDTERALAIFRQLARKSKDSTVTGLAKMSAASYLVGRYAISEVSDRDRALIDEYASDVRHIRGMDFLNLALFYAGETAGNHYAGSAFRRSRELLIAGMNSRNDKARDACIAQLDAWGVRPIPAQPPTLAQKAGDAAKITGVAGGIGVVMFVWSAIGLFLISVAAAINAFMIPIVLIAVGIAFAAKFIRRS